MKRDHSNGNVVNKLRLLLAASVSTASLLTCALAVPVFTAGLLMPAMTVRAQEWTEDYYRASDKSGELTEAERNELDSTCLKFMQDYHVDLALVSAYTDDLGGGTLEEAAARYYNECGFGYGENRDGFQMIYNLDTNEAAIVAFGSAADLIPEGYIEKYEESIPQFREEYGIFGPFYATTRHLNNYMEKHPIESSDKQPETDVQPITETADPMARVGEGASMLAWYPVDPSSFPDYHDETAPRVVDVADLFTEDEELQMESRLAELRAELQKDIVVFTDVSSYGLDHSIYSADFYDFNGYGIGDEFEGVVLFICMDPNDRGWWVCCTGPETKALYTEEIANQIDDMLYDFMVSGYYYAGVCDWIENFRRLYKNGSPYLEDWATQDMTGFARFHDESAARVVDDAYILSDEEIASITAKAREVSDKYGIDIAVHTAISPGPMTEEEYSERFYYLNGYGKGDDYDGIMLTLFKRPHYIAYPAVYGSGKCVDKLTGTNEKRLRSRSYGSLEEKEYALAAEEWIDHVDHMMRTGRVPQSRSHWILCTVLALIVGITYGIFSLIRAQRTMDTPAIAENANMYYVDKSLKIYKVADTFLHNKITKVYSPRQTRSSSGGGSSSSGRSSYKSSYSGSSGRSHSGSGRRF